MLVETITSQYEMSHGHRPRGVGAWAFAFEPYPKDMNKMIWVNGSFGEAKRYAIRVAREMGERRLYVQP